MLRCGAYIDDFSPKLLTKTNLFQRFCFWTSQDEGAFQLSQQNQPTSFRFFVHSAIRTPSQQILSYRDFVGICYFRVCSEQRAEMVVQGIDWDERLQGFVRGTIQAQLMVFEQGEGSTKLTQFL